MSSDSEDCTSVGKLFHIRAAVELNARPPMVTCSVRGTSSMAVNGNQRCSPGGTVRWGNAVPCCADIGKQARTANRKRKVIRSGTRSQCSSLSNGDTWSNFRRSSAAAVSTDWRQQWGAEQGLLSLTPLVLHYFNCVACTKVNPLASTWPHLRCDVGLKEDEYREKCLCMCTIIMVHKGTSSSYRLVDCIGLWSCLV